MTPLPLSTSALPLRFTFCLLAAAALTACGGGTGTGADTLADAPQAMASAEDDPEAVDLSAVADINALGDSEVSTDTAVAGVAAENDDDTTTTAMALAAPPGTVDGSAPAAPGITPPPAPAAPGITPPPAPAAPGITPPPGPAAPGITLPPTPVDPLAVSVDLAQIPAKAIGQSADRVKNSGKLPNSTSIGAFRTLCNFSHMANDDPIVFPGQPGRSHLHTFFGNTGVNAYTTANSLAHTGNSTCGGGTVNRSGYWVPSMIDTKTRVPVKPKSAIIYYKTGYNGIKPKDVKPFPAGLRMIAGDPKNTRPKGAFQYKCIGKGAEHLYGPNIQNCPAGTEMWQVVFFPQCWDGVNLDSPDHKSHMSYTVNKACPKTHPVALPEITFNITYPVNEANAPMRWRLTSDTYDRSLPAGYSSHGDWFNGWNQDIMESWVKNCDQASKDCHASLLGDGREIF